MITPEMSDALKEFLGHDYAKKILNYLKENQIRKDNGKNYLRQDIYNCVNSREGRHYPELEVAIFDFVAEEKIRNEQELARRQALLK